MNSEEMFQPNSIRSLLNKRASSRAGSATSGAADSAPLPRAIDSDYDAIVQTKIMIKDIDNKVSSIREWRRHQKELMEEKIKCNTELAQELNKERIKAAEREQEFEKEQLKRALKGLAEQTGIKIEQNEEEYDSDRIFEALAITDHLRNAIKNSQEVVNSDENESFLRSINSINDIFHKRNTEQGEEAGQEKEGGGWMEVSALIQKEKAKEESGVDQRKLVSQELEEIERELREMEELLKDE